MASNLAGPTWKIDAADSVLPRTILGTQQQSSLMEGRGPKATITQCMALAMIQWNAVDAAIGDQVIMTDFAGNEVYRSAPATGANFSDQTKFADTTLAVGLVVTSLPHGVLTLNFR